jgi:hypothetical protein
MIISQVAITPSDSDAAFHRVVSDFLSKGSWQTADYINAQN